MTKKIKDTKERQFDDFDVFASDYRDILRDNIKITGVDSDYFSDHKIRVLQEYENYSNLDQIKFLDFGCGDGNSSKFFTKHFQKGQYVGIDISVESIEIANKNIAKNVAFKHFDGLSIPFEDNSFDMVFTACVLHHIEFINHPQIFKEILRVLKPGGKFYIFEHNPFNPITRSIVNTCQFDEDAVLLYPNYTRNTLAKNGFSDISINYILFFPRHKLFNLFIKFERFFRKLFIGGQYYAVGTKN